MNPNIELSLLEAEEKEMLNYIWELIPASDRQGMTQSDVLLVLDLMDDYLAECGLLEEDANTEEVTYLVYTEWKYLKHSAVCTRSSIL